MQLAAGRYQLLDPIASKRTIVGYAEEVGKEYDKKMHLPKSVKYLRVYAEDTALRDVDERFVDGFRAFLLQQSTIEATTAAHYLAALKALLSRAERECLMDRNPAKGSKSIRIPEARKPYLNIGEIQTLYDTPAEGDLADECKRGFLLACFTVLRLGDIRN